MSRNVTWLLIITIVISLTYTVIKTKDWLLFSSVCALGLFFKVWFDIKTKFNSLCPDVFFKDGNCSKNCVLFFFFKILLGGICVSLVNLIVQSLIPYFSKYFARPLPVSVDVSSKLDTGS